MSLGDFSAAKNPDYHLLISLSSLTDICSAGCINQLTQRFLRRIILYREETNRALSEITQKINYRPIISINGKGFFSRSQRSLKEITRSLHRLHLGRECSFKKFAQLMILCISFFNYQCTLWNFCRFNIIKLLISVF